MKSCPCGSNNPYKYCCGIYISGNKYPATPEQLMRSRYTAYSRGNINYIAATMCGPAAAGFDLERAKKCADATTWLELKVIAAPTVIEPSAVGYVEFKAYFVRQGKKQCLHEISEFHYINNRWYYTDGRLCLEK